MSSGDSGNNYRKSAEYAGNQIKLFITDINNSSHNIRVKATKRFLEYINNNRPEVIRIRRTNFTLLIFSVKAI